LNGDLTEEAGSLREAERSLHRPIKDFDGVDGEEFRTGASISIPRVVDPAVSGKSGC
jgi:hypothetical protein